MSQRGQHANPKTTDTAHEAGTPSPLPFWEQCKLRTYQKLLYRSTILRTTNPDYIAAHPNECKGNMSILQVHPEAKARILKELNLKQDLAKIPIVDRPSRYNRT